NKLKQTKGLYIRLADNSYFKKQYFDTLEAIRKDYLLPTLPGTSDIYGYVQTYMITSFNKWNPHPAFQHASTTTLSRFSKLNQQHLEHFETAPDNIFYRLLPLNINLHFPTMYDSLNLPIILNNYHLIGEYKDYLIFRKNSTMTDIKLDENLFISSYSNFNTEIDISQYKTPIFIKLDINLSSFGNLLNFLFKITPVYIKIELDNNKTYIYRLNPLICDSGFVLSPLITSNFELKKFIQSGKDLNFENKVKSFSLILSIDVMKNFYLSRFTPLLYKDTFSYSLFALD
ncbi:MAG: hypothetical protein LBF22_01275, partial [Deltaproteobacteria bacterium]|nr:hypothetical protein [Deltaproteobacteria bacterium]